ncbi:MAG: hypothetical protein QM661_15055 [Solimonas sp.]
MFLFTDRDVHGFDHGDPGYSSRLARAWPVGAARKHERGGSTP